MKFLEQDINNQRITDSAYWNCIFPSDAVFEQHVLFVIKRSEAQYFHELTLQEHADLMVMIRHIRTYLISTTTTFEGYNLFCNNGSEAIGQHMQQFHMHAFFRSSSELESPYAIMGKQDKSIKYGTPLWNKNLAKLRQMFEVQSR